ncbi:hypothetical protein BT93_B0587 [Corymbia citriodora subsp. variegata]|nr:hypothetical protein BT93_B0587 [Corymbia citriodora subsp. variegata]
MLPAFVIVLSAVTSGANLFSPLKYQLCAFTLLWNIILSQVMLFYLKIPSYVAFFLQGVPEQKFRAHLCFFGGQKSSVAFAKITFKKPRIVWLLARYIVLAPIELIGIWYIENTTEPISDPNREPLPSYL